MKYQLNKVPVGTAIAPTGDITTNAGVVGGDASNLERCLGSVITRPTFCMVQFACLASNAVTTDSKTVDTFNARMQTLAVSIKSKTTGRRTWNRSNLANAFIVGTISRGVVANIRTLRKIMNLNVGPVNAFTKSDIVEILDVLDAYEQTFLAYANVTPVLPYQVANLNSIGLYQVGDIHTAVLCDSFGFYYIDQFVGLTFETNFEVTTMSTNLDRDLRNLLQAINNLLSDEVLQAASDCLEQSPRFKAQLAQSKWETTRRKIRNAVCGYTYGSKNKKYFTDTDNAFGEENNGAIAVDQLGGIWNGTLIASCENNDLTTINAAAAALNLSGDSDGMTFEEAASLPWGFYGPAITSNDSATKDGGTTCYMSIRCVTPFYVDQFMLYDAHGTYYSYPTWSLFTWVNTRLEPTQGIASNRTAVVLAMKLGLVGALNVVSADDGDASTNYTLSSVPMLDTQNLAITGKDVIERIVPWVLDVSFDIVEAQKQEQKKDQRQKPIK